MTSRLALLAAVLAFPALQPLALRAAADAGPPVAQTEPRLARPLYVGVEIIPVDDPTRALFKLPPAGGLLVIGVAPGSPSDGKLGQGDIVLKLDDQLLVNREQLRSLVRNRKPGDDATFTVVRGGRSETIVLKLAEVPAGLFRAEPVFPSQALPFDSERNEELLRRLTERTRHMLDDTGLDPSLMNRASVTVDGVNFGVTGPGINIVTSRSIVRPEGRVTTVTRNGKTTIIVKDATGKVIAEGEPTDALRAKLPDWAKEALDSKRPEKKPSGAPQTPVASGEHSGGPVAG